MTSSSHIDGVMKISKDIERQHYSFQILSIDDIQQLDKTVIFKKAFQILSTTYEHQLRNSGDVIELRSDCYAIVSRSVGDCWLQYAIVHCVAQNVTITCSGGGGGSNGTGGGAPSGWYSGNTSGGGGGGSSTITGSGGGPYGGSISVTNFDFEWKPNPSHFEKNLNCPPGEYHRRNAFNPGIKQAILRDWGAPCNNPDVHLDEDDNIIIVCTNSNYEQNTGYSIYNYSCD